LLSCLALPCLENIACDFFWALLPNERPLGISWFLDLVPAAQLQVSIWITQQQACLPQQNSARSPLWAAGRLVSQCYLLGHCACLHLPVAYCSSCGQPGKSSLTVQFVDGHFVESYYPTIENTFSKVVKYKGQEYATEIIDTAGQVRDISPLPPRMSTGTLCV
jgi:hypothetical protein